jgi:mono/diheme cytochrome c family protein
MEDARVKSPGGVMKKLGKILLWTVITLIVLLAIGISLTIGWRPILGPRARPLTSRQFERTPQRLERGRYLFTASTGCTGCHSLHDWNTHGGPILPGGEGVGQVMWFKDLPGRIVAPNITADAETGAGAWTDDQLARAIREGIGHDGRALFPMMPYQNLRHMSDEDLASLVVYIRSLPPVRNPLPHSEIIFPVRYLIRSAPQPVAEPVSSPDRNDRLRWGEYLITISSCNECHTPQARGATKPGLEYSGGFALDGPWGAVASANITPDATGIGYYDEALFIQAMRTGYVKARKLNSIMPFGEFGALTDDDLKAMFAYVRTLKPVRHRVDNSLPPTYCKLCQFQHGAGDQN